LQIEQLDLAWQQQEQNHTARSPLDREKLKKETRQLLGLSNSSVNVVATGVTGSGKASLINGLRGLRNKQPSAAPVGETNATGLSWYADVSGEWKFYKLAKQATFNASGKDYFEENGLYAFDAIVIVFTVGLRQIDATLCKEAKNWGVPVYFVRNKCDEVLTAAEGDFGLTLDEGKAQLRNNTRQMLQSSLEFCGASQSDLYYVTADSYVLPSKLLFKMDEERLKTRVMQRTG
jgi:GTP-binding protein EngB required for normal cell division